MTTNARPQRKYLVTTAIGSLLGATIYAGLVVTRLDNGSNNISIRGISSGAGDHGAVRAPIRDA